MMARDDAIAATVVALERAALDRWARGDTLGDAAGLAETATYFDHATPERLHGAAAIRAHVAAFQNKFTFPRHEMLDPVVHCEGNLAVLAFKG